MSKARDAGPRGMTAPTCEACGAGRAEGAKIEPARARVGWCRAARARVELRHAPAARGRRSPARSTWARRSPAAREGIRERRRRGGCWRKRTGEPPPNARAPDRRPPTRAARTPLRAPTDRTGDVRVRHAAVKLQDGAHPLHDARRQERVDALHRPLSSGACRTRRGVQSALVNRESSRSKPPSQLGQAGWRSVEGRNQLGPGRRARRVRDEQRTRSAALCRRAARRAHRRRARARRARRAPAAARGAARGASRRDACVRESQRVSISPCQRVLVCPGCV